MMRPTIFRFRAGGGSRWERRLPSRSSGVFSNHFRRLIFAARGARLAPKGEQSVSGLLNLLVLARIPQEWTPVLRTEYAQVKCSADLWEDFEWRIRVIRFTI